MPPPCPPRDCHAAAGDLTLLELLFTVLFLVELVAKALFLPWNDFVRSGRNRFDAAVTLATCATTVVVYLPNGLDSPEAVEAMITLRLLRLLRLLVRVEVFRVVAITFVKILP